MNPLVTVILTSYNRPIYLEKAVQSIVEQSYQNWELLIYDDNSSVDVYTPIRQFTSDPRISFYKMNTTYEDRIAKCRYAHLINIGLKRANGKYVTYLTDDDYYLPTRLERMVAMLESSDDISVVFGKQLLLENGLPVGVRNERSPSFIERAACIVDHN